MKYIKIEDNGTPKYQQIINGIINGISDGELKINDKLPSINNLIKEFNLSQDTILNAYNNLKSKGIVSSAVGKGYYVSSDITYEEHKVFVLFDNFTSYKEKIYNAINNKVYGNGRIDIFFHHNNKLQFEKLINDAIGNYTSFIIMSIEQDEMDDFLINTLPPKNVYLLDIASARLKKKFPFVAQNFEKDIDQCLSKNLSIIKKYSNIRFLNSSVKPHILRINKGLNNFTKRNNIPFNEIVDIHKSEINKGDLFIVIKDNDLIELIEKSNQETLSIGEDIGIISYNETGLKKVIHNGISTISTNFDLMGSTIAQLAINRSRDRIYNEFNLIIRNSL